MSLLPNLGDHGWYITAGSLLSGLHGPLLLKCYHVNTIKTCLSCLSLWAHI